MAEPAVELPKSPIKELPPLGVRPFELELADRIAQSDVLPTLKKLERSDYDFSRVEKGPNIKQQVSLFGVEEIAEFAKSKSLDYTKAVEFAGETEFNGKKYNAVRIVYSEPHKVEGITTTEGYPSKVLSVLLLREVGTNVSVGEGLNEKLEKLVDKSGIGRRLQDVDLNEYDSVIFGLWANPTRTTDYGVVYQEAQLEVLHPDYSSSRRAMQYTLSVSFGRRQSSISSEPLRTDKTAAELRDEEIRRAERSLLEDPGAEKPAEEKVRRIPSRTAWFDFDGNNITAKLKEKIVAA